MRLRGGAPQKPRADALLRAAMRGSGLRGAQFTLLATLIQTGPMPTTRLADFLGLDRTTLTRNLGPLLRDGHVTIEDGADRRVHKVAITAKGADAASAPFLSGERRRTPRWRGRRGLKNFGSIRVYAHLTRSSRHVRNSVSHRINRQRFDRRRFSVARAGANLARAPGRRRRSRRPGSRSCSRSARPARSILRAASAFPDWA